MQSAVERSAVRVATGSMFIFGLVYLGLAIQTGEWTWWLICAELMAMTVVGLVQLRSDRVSLPFLWVLVVAATTMTTHLVPDPHRVGVGVTVAAIAATGWLLVDSGRRRQTLFVMAAFWAAQVFFPGARGWPMAYQATAFLVMILGLRSIGDVVQKSRDRYQRLFEQAPIALWEEDFSEIDRWLHRLRRTGVRDLRAHLEQHPDEIDRALAMVQVLDVNPAAADLVEVEDSAGLLGPIDPSTYTAETRPAFLEQVMTVWEGRSEMKTELGGRTMTGRPIRAIMQWVAAPGPHGTPDYGRVVVSIQDVSELKKAQRKAAEALDALEAKEEQLRTVVADAPVILFALDADGVYTVAEGRGLDRLGLTSEDIVGTTCFDAWGDEPAILEPLQRAMAGEEQVVAYESDGRRWENRLTPLIDEDGRPAGVIGVSTDVTDRVEMEQALEGARRRNRLIVRNMSDLLFSVDAVGRIEFVSPSVEAILGYQVDEVVGSTVASLVHPEDLGEVLGVLEGVGLGQTTPSLTPRVRRGDGSWVPLEAHAVNMLDDPELAVWVVTGRDVTAQQEARRELEQALDTAEAATRAKSELLANVSHEIRTPMNAILGMTDLALGTDLEPDQEEYLATVRTSAESLLTIINDLLDLARVEAGHLSVETVPFSIGGTLRDVIRTMQVRADQKGVSLRLQVDDGISPWVMGDPGRLRQVVMNLVGNAIKFTDDGDVVVTAGQGEDSLVRFVVRDTGIGIAQDHLERIFSAFEQADGSMNRRFGGTGLGLAISSKLVDAMGGTIEVDSTVGEGSIFTFTADLPATTALTAVGGAGMAGGPALVIGGQQARDQLVDSAVAAGYEAIAVGSAAEAQTLAAGLVSAGRRPGALILDLPDPDLEFCRRLMASEILGGTPVIVVTGAGRRGDGARFRGAGVRAYLTRPLGESDLRETLSAIASNRAPEGILITRHWLRERRRPLQVLLADDSATNRMLASRILEQRGHHIVEVGDGAAAAEAVLEGVFDVVLMDVQMPGMDGLEATRLIRARERETEADRVPIIALTAHATGSDRDRCLAVGMDGYLSKPYGADDLIGAVEAGAAVGSLVFQAGGERAEGFLESYPVLVDDLEEAIGAGRTREAAGCASRLAVGLGRIGADEAASAAGRLAEDSGAAPAVVAANFARLSAALDRIEPEISALRGRDTEPARRSAG